jgi:uncharacterized protein YndB with AHSA1/START domain
VRSSEPFATGQVTIKASPPEVYRLVSDPQAMASFAEELFKVRWLGGATRAAVGAKFSGTNRNGWRRWVTRCRITDLEQDRRFAYEVKTPFLVPISRWQYDIAPSEQGCTVTESNWLHVPGWFRPIANWITGERDRRATNLNNITITLARLKEHVESAPEQRPAA